MITPIAVPIEDNDTPSRDRVLRVPHGGGVSVLENFPILYIGKDSYLVSGQDDSGLNLNNDYVYNLHIGRYSALAHEIKFVIDINHNYKNVSTGILKQLAAQTVQSVSVPQVPRKGQILIQNDVWIGRGATIMGGVTIHNGAVVAANSVVTKEVPPYSIVGGNPAKVIKYRFDKDVIEKLLSIQWWNWSNKEIAQNIEWFTKDAETFASHFYNASPFQPAAHELDLEKFSHQFLYFADFDEGPFSTWEKVLTEFCQTFSQNPDYRLIMFLQQGSKVQRQAEAIAKAAEQFNCQCALFLFTGDDKDEEAIFRYADSFITSRKQKTVYYSCLADFYGLKTYSGVDLPIFR